MGGGGGAPGLVGKLQSLRATTTSVWSAQKGGLNIFKQWEKSKENYFILCENDVKWKCSIWSCAGSGLQVPGALA